MDAYRCAEVSKSLLRLATGGKAGVGADYLVEAQTFLRAALDAAASPLTATADEHAALRRLTAACRAMAGSEGRVTPAAVRARIRQAVAVLDMVVSDGVVSDPFGTAWAESASALFGELTAEK